MMIDASHTVLTGFVVTLTGKIVYDWLKTPKQTKKMCVKAKEIDVLGKSTEDIKDDVMWLRDAHENRTEDGVFNWYFPSSLNKTLHALLTNSLKTVDILGRIEHHMEKQNEQMVKNTDQLARNGEALNRLDDDVKRSK